MVLGFFSISGGEIFIIILVVFLFFGPDKIPEIARWLGKGMSEVKKATSEIRDEITRETEDLKKETDSLKKDLQIDNPLKNMDSMINSKEPPAKKSTDPGTEKKEPRL